MLLCSAHWFENGHHGRCRLWDFIELDLCQHKKFGIKNIADSATFQVIYLYHHFSSRSGETTSLLLTYRSGWSYYLALNLHKTVSILNVMPKGKKKTQGHFETFLCFLKTAGACSQAAWWWGDSKIKFKTDGDFSSNNHLLYTHMLKKKKNPYKMIFTLSVTLSYNTIPP